MHDVFRRAHLLGRDLLTSEFVARLLISKRYTLARGSQLQPVVLSCAGSVSLLHAFVVQVVVLEECFELLIATKGHMLQLIVAPRVHRQTANEGGVHAHRPVQGGAVHADEAAVVHGGPLRLRLGAVEADGVLGLELELLEDEV